jgi:acetoacetate decarboxylase
MSKVEKCGKLTPKDFSESMPVTHPLYPRAPYYYRNSKGLTFVYEIDEQEALARLPEELELVEPATAVLIIAENEFSTVAGRYSECYLNILCRYKGEEMLYSSNLFETAENAQLIGREIYGFPKKLCQKIEFKTTGAGDVCVTVDRFEGYRLLTAMMRPIDNQPLASFKDMPLVVLKIVPDAAGSKVPSLAQLVKVCVQTSPIVSSDGRAEIFTGPGHVHFDQPSEIAMPVRKMISCTLMRWDCVLPYGEILKTY